MQVLLSPSLKMDIKNNKNLKLRFSTIFRSSCRDGAISDASNPTLLHQQKPTTRPFPSINKSMAIKPDPARHKLSESYSLFYSAQSAPLLEKQSMERTEKNHTTSRRRRRRKLKRRRRLSNNVSCWSSSDDEALLLGSSRRMEKKKKIVDRRRNYEMEMEDSYAVVKCSRDPYMDFRTSMVEMIVENKMKKAEDLERLLQCFLSLNSYRHHLVIIEAFMDIWDVLFL